MNVVISYHSMIDRMAAVTGMTDKNLHVYAGLSLFMLGYLLTRRLSLAIVLVAIAEGGNEVMDRLYFNSWRWNDTLSDIAQTMFWPVMLILFLRFVYVRAPLRAA